MLETGDESMFWLWIVITSCFSFAFGYVLGAMMRVASDADDRTGHG